MKITVRYKHQSVAWTSEIRTEQKRREREDDMNRYEREILTIEEVGHFGHHTTSKSHPAVEVNVVLISGGVSGSRIVIQPGRQCLITSSLHHNYITSNAGASSAYLRVQFPVSGGISTSPTIGQRSLPRLQTQKQYKTNNSSKDNKNTKRTKKERQC